jgi:hypothetical protein
MMTTQAQKAAVYAELEQVSAANGGLLVPRKVVDFAADRKTALHDCFEWNNHKAGDEYRLWQARELITVFVTVVGKDEQPVQAFVSLRTDRAKTDGGYRSIVDVMTDKEMRQQLLADALDDAERWQAKYASLTELVPVFQALARLRTKRVKDAA